MSHSLQDQINNSWAYATNANYILQLYEAYKQGRLTDSAWINFFEMNPNFCASDTTSINQGFVRYQAPNIQSTPQKTLSAKLDELKKAYQQYAHLQANINPLQKPQKNLTIQSIIQGLTPYFNETIDHSLQQSSLIKVQDYNALLEHIYSDTFALEAYYLPQEEQDWCYEHIESLRATITFENKELLHTLLKKLIATDTFERYLGNKYPGAKRFSIEGADGLFIILDELIRTSVKESHVKEVIIGLTHRGRLNILVNLLGKKTASLFEEFEGTATHKFGTGDVKYHQGFSSEHMIDGEQIHVSVAFNPSHLEIIGPVVAGTTLARQQINPTLTQQQILPIIVHGDSAFAGQGVVMELINMSQTRGYGVGGTVHVVVNNQIGFTTSAIEDTRSTYYCTDIAKMIQVPVLHINGDDPLAIYQAAIFAARWRERFAKDIIIDLVCYRRHGHNEADEPAVTQPLMYDFIRQHPAPQKIFADKLIQEQIINQQDVETIQQNFRTILDKGDSTNKDVNDQAQSLRFTNWAPYLGKSIDNKAQTKVDKEILQHLGTEIIKKTSGIKMHPRVAKIYEDRAAMYADQKALDWGAAELLAYASLMNDGYNVRLSGQDCRRGTFFHRHALIVDQQTNEVTEPLVGLPEVKGLFTAIDSLLSEEAVLAFEYGYATTDPRTLVLWEAQFGDFANGAQVVIDQFIASGEQKWMRHCALVLLLPHGYEGQGPEHSSARIERFLQLAAQNNMRICIPTTPAQLFHLLRLQMLAQDRHPLVIFSPKSFLRHKDAVSTLDFLSKGRFQEVLAQQQHEKPVSKLVFCSGKIYYDLLTYQQEHKSNHVVIIRIEQLYPFPTEKIEKILTEYGLVKDIFWAQEEPKNQGAWTFIQPLLSSLLSQKTLNYIGRAEGAAPAVGHAQIHQQEQELIIKTALT
jgi:2-oxoglutarate dehydrogenase E1 component